MGRINLKYPYERGSRTFDGRIHQIKPINLTQYPNTDLYLLEYYDETLHLSMVTILRRRNGVFFKYPLTDYDSHAFNEFCERVRSTGIICDVNLLQDNIDAVTPLSFQEVFEDAISKKARRAKAAIAVYKDGYGNFYITKEAAHVIGFPIDDRIRARYLPGISNKEEKTEFFCKLTKEDLDYISSIYHVVYGLFKPLNLCVVIDDSNGKKSNYLLLEEAARYLGYKITDESFYKDRICYLLNEYNVRRGKYMELTDDDMRYLSARYSFSVFNMKKIQNKVQDTRMPIKVYCDEYGTNYISISDFVKIFSYDSGTHYRGSLTSEELCRITNEQLKELQPKYNITKYRDIISAVQRKKEKTDTKPERISLINDDTITDGVYISSFRDVILFDLAIAKKYKIDGEILDVTYDYQKKTMNKRFCAMRLIDFQDWLKTAPREVSQKFNLNEIYKKNNVIVKKFNGDDAKFVEYYLYDGDDNFYIPLNTFNSFFRGVSLPYQVVTGMINGKERQFVVIDESQLGQLVNSSSDCYYVFSRYNGDIEEILKRKK